MSKKTILFLTVGLLCAMTFAAGKEKKGAKAAKPKTLVEQGLSLISLMKEKAENKKLINLYSGSDELNNIIQEIASQGVSKPSEVYRLSGDFSFLFSLMTMEFDTADMQFSSELKEEVAKRFLSSIPSIWNAKTAGATPLAAASLLTCTKAFVSKELSQDCIFLYEFHDAYPVAVCFLRGEDNAVMATSTIIVDKDFIKWLQDFLKEYDVMTIKKIQ